MSVRKRYCKIRGCVNSTGVPSSTGIRFFRYLDNTQYLGNSQYSESVQIHQFLFTCRLPKGPIRDLWISSIRQHQTFLSVDFATQNYDICEVHFEAGAKKNELVPTRFPVYEGTTPVHPNSVTPVRGLCTSEWYVNISSMAVVILSLTIVDNLLLSLL